MSYPTISEKKFKDKINSKYKKYQISTKKKPYDEICFPKTFELQLPQQFVSNFINPLTPYKGLLIFHKIGSGKTCSAIQIAEQWKNERKIVIVCPASLKGNFVNELRGNCVNSIYTLKREQEELKTLDIQSKRYKEILENIDVRIEKYYNIYSFNKFVDLITEKKIKLNNTLLIIDEVQNIVSESGSWYGKLKNIIHSAPADLRVVIMSATPIFDRPKELALTLNLLRLPTDIPEGNEFNNIFIDADDKIIRVKNLDFLKKLIKGYVSYFRGPPNYAYPKKKITYVDCKMSEFQYNVYKLALAKHAYHITQYPPSFLLGVRLVSNVALPNKKFDEDGFKLLLKDMKNLKKYSTKLHTMMNSIQNTKGKVFIYSNFKEYGGIKTIKLMLEYYGYKDFYTNGTGKNRFAVWSSDEPSMLKDRMKLVFNSPDNTRGEKIRIIIGSPASKEGHSFFAINHMHILEPYWNQSRMDQIIGRAVRYCSHRMLSDKERYVNIYIYIATHQMLDKSVDQHIIKLADAKNNIIKEFEKALKEVAVDCTLNYAANKEDGYKCD